MQLWLDFETLLIYCYSFHSDLLHNTVHVIYVFLYFHLSLHVCTDLWTPYSQKENESSVPKSLGSEAGPPEKLVVKKEAAEGELKDDDLLEDTDDYEDGEEEEEDGDVELVDETPEDGQHRAEDRFFLGTLAKLFRGQASQSSREKLDIITVVSCKEKE